MDEVIDGVLHWATFHEGIGQTVHSHLHVPSGAVFDPRLPEGGVEALSAAALPGDVLLSNRHHLRHAQALAEAYGSVIRCHEAGLHAFAGDDQPDVQGFAFGDEVVPGVTALELGALTPEDTVFHLGVGPGALLFADGLIRQDGELMFVPDSLMGEDPEGVKRGLRARLAELAERDDFDVLLFAHGEPVRTGGREELRTFLR
jgi:glyoxylase-like metal-dependent hydrolase (beta-lactamase superfamily II)